MEEKLLIKPEDVIIPEDMPRFRQDNPNIKSLLASFEKHGQLVPAILNRNYELIDGGRRLAACVYGGRNLWYVFNDTTDKLKMREMEFEANVQREDFTPADHALAVQELHRLKVELYGQANPGLSTEGWSIDDTAKIMNVSKASVADNLNIASIIEAFPELKSLKTASEIKKAKKSIDNILSQAHGVKKYEEVETDNKVVLKHLDAASFLVSLQNETIDLILTDPPYGIDIGDVAMTVGGKTGGDVTTAGYKFDDSLEEALKFTRFLAPESFRVAKPNGQAYVFMAPEFFGLIRQIWIEAGWNVYFRPLIWIKTNSGQNNQPDRWPSSCYEMIMYARKPEAVLIKQGQPDWFQFTPVTGGKRHINEKPVDLLRMLIQRSVHPGATMIDPCMGSGSSIVAGIKEKLICYGCDKLEESYNAACDYVADTLKEEGEP